MEDEIVALAADIAARKSADMPGLKIRIDDAVERWPGAIRPRLLKSDLLDGEGLASEADAVLIAACEDFPGHPAPLIRAIPRLARSGRVDQAIALFRDQAWSSSRIDEPQRLALLNQVIAGIADLDRRHALLLELLDDRPSDRFCLVKLAMLALRDNDRVEALALIDRAAALGELPPEGELIAARLLIAHARFDEAITRTSALAERFPQRPEVIRQTLEAADLGGRTDIVERLLPDAIARWPDDWMMLFRYNRAALNHRLDAEIFTRLEAAAAECERDGRWTFQLALAALRHERIARALALLRAIPPAHPAAAMAAPLRDALDTRSIAAWNNPRGVSNDIANEIQVRMVPRARATCIVFAGVQGGLGYLPFALGDTIFADYPINMIYLRDAANRSFADGLRGIAGGEERMLAELRRIAEACGGAPVVTIGSSVGGIAAARAGALLRAAACLSFAAPLHIDSASDGKPRFRVEAFANVVRSGGDLLGLIRAAAPLHLYHCYGTGHPADVAVAETIRDLPHLSLIPVDCADHFPLNHLLAGQAFDPLFRRLLDGVAPQ